MLSWITKNPKRSRSIVSNLFSFAKIKELVLLLRSNYSAREYSCEAKLTILLFLRSRIHGVFSPGEMPRSFSCCICMGMISCPITIALFLLSVFPSAAWSDSIILKSGKKVQGTIEARTDKFIQVNVGLDFPITYYLDEVKDIVSDQNSVDSKQTKPPSVDIVQQADDLEQQGLSAIDDGRMDEGLALLRKAVALHPRANRHLNLGTILSGNGVALFKKGLKAEAAVVFKDSERELQEAVKLFDPKTESIFLSQAYFLLGELYAQGMQDQKEARKFYQKSISFYPNSAAERGLKALNP